HTIRLWEVSTGQCLNVLQGHAEWVRSVAFSPDGHLLVSGSNDHTIRLWDVSTGQCLNVLQGHTTCVASVTFSHDGSLLLSGSDDGTMKLWNVDTGTCQLTLRADRPYERMNITGAAGLIKAQKEALKILGAIEKDR